MSAGAVWVQLPSCCHQGAVDLHHDDVIEYDEFVPVATEILKSQTGMKAKSAPVRKAAPKKKAAMPSLGDDIVPPAIFQDYMTKLFKIGDVLSPYRIRSSAEDA